MDLLPSLPSADALAKIDIFPYIESRQFEFKKSIGFTDKIAPTLCAFLNSDGGYMIFGIEDTTRRLIGLKNTYKQVDSFITSNVDSIYHTSTIVEQETGKPVDPEQIKTSIVERPNGTYIIIIQAVRKDGVQYQMNDGHIYYRINASNYRVKNEKIYTEIEVKNMLSLQKKESTKNYTNLVNCLNVQIREHEKMIQQLATSLRNISVSKDALEGNYKTVEQLLFTKICIEKDAASEVLSQKQNICSRLFSFMWFK